MSSSSVITITGLSYSYAKEAKTLVDVDLQVEQGSIYGFIGPNGSGKTTTLRLLLNLLQLQEGNITIFGQALYANRCQILKKVGSLIESPSLYHHLTAMENLEVYRQVYGIPKARVEEVLKLVELNDTGKKAVKAFSLGMKQRLAIALALLPSPELLILDEPANGLDPNGIIALRELIKKLNKEQGITILISSHLLTEVEKMVSHLGIIYKGQMLFQGSLEGLYRLQQSSSQLQIQTSDNEAASKILQYYAPEKSGKNLFLSFEDIGQVAKINRMLIYNDIDVYLLQPKEHNLEQLFMHLTNNHL